MSADARLFGTDGMRGPFGTYPLDEPTVTALGRELARSLQEEAGGGSPQVVIGGDTRESTPTLSAWVARGVAAGGGVARYVGVVPTAGIARAVRTLGAAAGAVVSASHNPYPDNGIKLIDGDGFKWSEAREAAFEARLLAAAGRGARDLPAGAVGGLGGPAGFALGAPESAPVAAYLDALAASLPAAAGSAPLAGLRVALDTGNGAASAYAGPLFTRLGAEPRVIHAAPDGKNVNSGCGSTDTADLARTVREGGFDLGIAFDGDADRAILVDEHGEERDGDAILYLWARALAERGALLPRAIVATSMSNLGLERALEREGIGIVRCGVGDRVVVETMRERGIVLGGEQSGHVVHLDLTTTGDGLLTAVQIAYLVRQGASLSSLLGGFRRYPQVLVNVRVGAKPALDGVPGVRDVVREVEGELGGDGRLVLRYSGTEPLARVMIEGPDQGEVERQAGRIADAIRAAIGEDAA